MDAHLEPSAARREAGAKPDERRMTGVGVKASVRVQKRTEGVLEQPRLKM